MMEMAPPRNVPSHGRCKVELRVLRQALKRDLAITLDVDSPVFCRAGRRAFPPMSILQVAFP
jgi:hypothetical protein